MTTTLNTDIPIQPVHVHAQYLYDLQRAHESLVPGLWIGVSSVPGRAIGCHVLLENGALMGRLPLDALLHRSTPPDPLPSSPVADDFLPLDALELWDCPSADVSVWTIGHLAGHAVDARIAGAWWAGRYLCTLDWHGTSYAEDPGEHGWKCAHLLVLSNRQIAAMPNNRLRWHDPASVTPYETPPEYVTNTHVWQVEGRRRGTSGGYFYTDTDADTAQGVGVTGAAASTSVRRTRTRGWAQTPRTPRTKGR